MDLHSFNNKVSADQNHLKKYLELKEAQKITGTGSSFFDSGKETLNWSEENDRIFGIHFDCSEMTLGEFLELVLSEDRERVKESIQKAKNELQPFCLIYQIKCPDHKVRVIQSRAKPNADLNDPAMGLVITFQDITEEKTLRENLQNKLSLLQAIMEETSDPIFIKDNEGRYLIMNSIAAKNFDSKNTPEKLIGRTNKDLSIPPDSLKLMDESDLKILRTGEPLTYEISLIVKGVKKYFQTKKSPYRDQNGNIIGIVGISRDITELKLSEEKLRTEHAFRKPIEDSMLAGVAAVDLKGCMIYVNPAFCNMVGWKEEELIGTSPPYLFWPPEEIETISKILQDRIKGNGLREVEYCFRRKTGERFHVVSLASPLTDGYGKTIGVLSSFHDVTKRKEIENKLKHANQFLQGLIQSSPLAICLLNTEGIVHMWNPAAQKIFGWTEQEVLGHVLPIVPNEKWAEFRSNLKEVFQGKSFVGTEARRQRKGGSPIDVSFWTVGLTDDHGKKLCLSIIADISEKMSLQEDQRKTLSLLRATLESTEDGILAVDREGKKIITYNDQLLKMWKVPESILKTIKKTEDDSPLLSYNSTQVKNSEKFLKKVEELYKNPAKDSFDMVELKDGRVFERHSKPQLIGTENIGRVWSFRDVTKWKNAEEEQKKTLSLLHAALESTADGLLIVDRSGIITGYNNKFLKMWNIPKSIMETRNNKDALNYVLNQLIEPEHFLKKVKELYSDPEAESEDLLEFKDGRVFERYSQPQRIEGKTVGRVWSFRDITHRKQAEDRLSYLANFDMLTGLPNRTLFFDRLNQAMTRAVWRKRLVAVLFIDLDHFKDINDTLGHAFGDKLLKEVANRLNHCLREGDSIARMGGDEFVAILDDMEKVGDTIFVAQKIISVFSSPFEVDGREIYITPSIGIAVYPNDGKDHETLLRNADTAMYQAKELGRNNFQSYSPALNLKISERLTLENRIRHALEREEFHIHYQPKVDLHSGKIVGMEALIRWNQHDVGNISPAEFIPLAEETGLIILIGQWVLRQVCAQIKAWQSAGFFQLPVAVNLSAKQFQQQDLAESIAHILKQSKIHPKYLGLELTESVIMKNPETSVPTLQKLDTLGIEISVDDFGTGYSSLSYLKRFPVKTLKIDRSFVRDLTIDSDDKAIVAAIITLAHTLKLKVVAEGVETKEQVQFLKSLHCDQVQGFLFGKPRAPREIEKMMVKGSFKLSHQKIFVRKAVQRSKEKK